MKNFLKGIAAKLRNRKTDDIKVGDIKVGDIKVGDTVEIIASTIGHFFAIGSNVLIEDIDSTTPDVLKFWALGKHRDPTFCGDMRQVIRRSDFKKVKTPKKPINRAYVFIAIFLAVCCLTILFVPVDTAADIAKILLVFALGIGIGVALIMVIDPSTNEFCKSIDEANSLTENEDEWLGM